MKEINGGTRWTRAVRLALLALANLLTGACGGTEDAAPADCSNVVQARTCAAELATGDPLETWADGAGERPVVLYIDRSGSIRGFLDPAFPKQPTDYRSVIDGLVVGLGADSAFGFGDAIQPAPLSLGALHDRGFYRDSDTRMEQAFARIAADTALARSHVVVGDGRRGDTNAANAQYSAMRALAQRWIARGGTFAVAASLAPFSPVQGDPAGCRDAAGAEGERDTCPLYAFAFIAPGDEARIGSTLASVFEHLFVWPMPAARPGSLGLRAEPGPSGVTLHPGWAAAPDGSPIARAGGRQRESVPLPVDILVRDSTSSRGRLESEVLRGQEIEPGVSVRRLSLPPQPWTSAPATGSLVRPVHGEPMRLEVISHGAEAPGYLYRVDLSPRGTPSWLEQFDASSASDELRTFGLRWLFTGFETEAANAPPVGRVFIAAN